MDRAKLANDYHNAGYSCAQAVVCAFADVIGLPQQQLAALTGGFGGGFRTGEICGVLSGGAMVLGLLLALYFGQGTLAVALVGVIVAVIAVFGDGRKPEAKAAGANDEGGLFDD